MSSSQESFEAAESPDAASLFFAMLSSSDRVKTPEFERLCREYPDLEAELRTLERRWRRGHSAIAALGSDDADAPPEIVPGDRIADRYLVLGRLARGGMGDVFEVRDEVLGRRLAMKVLRRRTGSDSRSRSRAVRFFTEARVLARLTHPAIVPVHEVGVEESGASWFTMLLVEGDHLARFFETIDRSSPRDLLRGVELLRRVCEAIAHAHSREILHRDLKPENVMVGPFGETYVLDWGLARTSWSPRPTELDPGSEELEDEELSPTRDGDVLGTPAYMSPEQAAGRTEAVDPRSDVYSIGAMLYHLLAGHAPFNEPDSRRTPREVLSHVRRSPPDALDRIAPGHPVEIVAICEKAMQRDPAARYSSASDLASDLRAFVEGRVVRAHQTGALAELFKWTQRNRLLSSSMLGASVVLLTVLLFLLHTRGELQRASSESARKAEDLRRAVYRADMELTRHALEEGNFALARALLDGCPEDLRAFEWRYYERVSDTADATLPVPARVACWSEDGARIWTGGPDGSLCLWESRTLEPVLEIGGSGQACDRLVTDDSETLAVFRDGTIRAFGPDSTEGRQIARVRGSTSMSISPRGSFVVRHGRGRATYRLAGGVTRILDPFGVGLLVEASPRASRLLHAMPDGDGAWVLKDLESSEHTTLRLGVRPSALFPSSDLEFAVVLDHEDRLGLWSRERDKVEWFGRAFALSASVLWNPDGRRFALFDGECLSIVAVADLARRIVLAGRGSSRPLAWSPDGLRLLSAGEPARLWRIDGRRDPTWIPSPRDVVWGIAFDGTGGRIGCVTENGWLAILGARTGEELQRLRLPAGAARVTWRPGHDRLAVGGQRGSCWSVDLEGGDVRELALDLRDRVNSMITDGEGRRFFVASRDGGLVAVSWDSLQPEWRAAGPSVRELELWNDFLLASGPDVGVSAFDPRSGERSSVLGELGSATPEFLSRYDDQRLVLTTSDRRSLLAGTRGRPPLWDHPSGDYQGPLTADPDEERIFLAGPGGVAVVDGPTGLPITFLSATRFTHGHLERSPDGAVLASAGDGDCLRLWIGEDWIPTWP